MDTTYIQKCGTFLKAENYTALNLLTTWVVFLPSFFVSPILKVSKQKLWWWLVTSTIPSRELTYPLPKDTFEDDFSFSRLVG